MLVKNSVKKAAEKSGDLIMKKLGKKAAEKSGDLIMKKLTKMSIGDTIRKLPSPTTLNNEEDPNII